MDVLRLVVLVALLGYGFCIWSLPPNAVRNVFVSFKWVGWPRAPAIWVLLPPLLSLLKQVAPVPLTRRQHAAHGPGALYAISRACDSLG